MPKSQDIVLGDGTVIPIVYEDRSILAIDKPAGWMLAPSSWDRTGRNLQRALESALIEREFWVHCRQLKFLRFIHRLDADTSGLLLLAKNPGVLRTFQGLFEKRDIHKVYLAVVRGVPPKQEWNCQLGLAPDPHQRGKMRVHHASARRPMEGAKIAETQFHVLQSKGNTSLVEAQPITGRTHQIRVHLAAAGHPVLGDVLYGDTPLPNEAWPLALRAVAISYQDPFTGRKVQMEAPAKAFLKAFGFTAVS